jgi:toxin ParE1/3/4
MYILSEAADKDIEKLLERSILDFGLAQTEIYFKSLKSCLSLLSDNPELGRTVNDIAPNYRRFRHQSHVVFYRVQQQDIFIIRILHKAMDIENYLD